MPRSSRLDNTNGFLRGPDHAKSTFGLDNTNLYINNPKTKFEHFVRFNISKETVPAEYFKTYFDDAKDLDNIMALVKSASYPNIKLNMTKANQYNQRRHYYTSIDYDPISVTMHDVADGKTMRFWHMYYTYYFKNGQYKTDDKNFLTDQGRLQSLPNGSAFNNIDSTIKPDSSEHDGYGLNVKGANDSLFSSIEIFFSRAKTYQKVILINPKIIAFTHDNVDYQDTTGLMEINFEIDYETVIYDEDPRELTNSNDFKPPIESTTFDGGLPPTQPGKSKKVPEESHQVTDDKDLSRGQEQQSTETPTFFSELGNRAGKLIGKNVQSSLGNLQTAIGDNLQDNIVNSIKTGKLDFKPDPVESAKRIVGQGIANSRSGLLSATRKQIAQSIQDQAKSAVDDLKAQRDQENKTRQGGGT